MKKKHILLGMVFALCLICAGALCVPQTASAKGITKASQAKKLAKKQVKGATSIKVKKERAGMDIFSKKLEEIERR